MTRTFIVVSSPVKPGLAEAIAAGEAPRRDYYELQKTLGAELLRPPAQLTPWQKLLGTMGGAAVLMAWISWLRRDEYDVIVTDQESVGLVLALLFKLTRVQRGHVMISHYLSPFSKQLFFRLLRVQSHIDTTVCYSSAQARLARERLGLREDQIDLVLHPADSRFWRPALGERDIQADAELLREAGIDLAPDVDVVCSAGLEFRDYETLITAAGKLPAKTQVIIAAASPWSKRRNTAEGVDLPENVRRVSLNPPQLRALYRRSNVVAIPLYDVDFQAGSLVAYESMACGKPVVISFTRGQSDIVRDEETGYYVPPGDPRAMADMLNLLLSYPTLARLLGGKARTVVESGMNLDRYLETMEALVHRVASKHSYTTAPVGQTI
jgi:glycosyltransferase involved in cell wall biosynthesis